MSSPLRSAIVLMTWVNCHASRGLIQSTGDALNAGFCRARFSFFSTFSSFSLLLLNAVERAVKKCESLIGRIGSFTRLLAIRWSPQFRSSNRPCGARPDVTDADQVSLSRNGLPSFWIIWKATIDNFICERNWSIALCFLSLLRSQDFYIVPRNRQTLKFYYRNETISCKKCFTIFYFYINYQNWQH